MAATSSTPSAPTSTYVARLATVALVAVAYFGAIIVALHFLRSDLDPIARTTSEYAVGHHRYLMTSAFFSMSVASLALLIGLYNELSPAARSEVGLVLVAVWSIGVLIAMIFPIDVDGAPQTTSGTIHRITGPLTFLSLSVGTILISRRFKHDENWRPIYRIAVLLSATILGGFIATFLSVATESGFAGLGQRFTLAVFVTWFVLTALHLRVHALERTGQPGQSLNAEREIDAPKASPAE